MKKVQNYFLFFLFLSLYSCSDNPTDIKDNSSELGKVFLAIDMSNAPSDVVDIKGVLSRNGYNSILFNFFYDDTTNSATCKVDEIPTGKWNLQVDAFNIDSAIIYSGSTTVSVEPAALTNVSLYLNSTSGSIEISVKWGNVNTLSDLNEFLIGYWDFENNGIYDLSPYSNNGIVFGNSSFSKGISGNAINFVGYDGYAEIPDNSVFNCEEKTISFWLYKNNNYILETEGKNDGEGVVGKAYDSGLNRDFTFAISGNNPNFHIYGTVGTKDDTLIVTGKTQAIAPQKWYHCTLVVGRNYTEFYLNGKLTEYSYKANSSINSTAPIILGKAFVSSLPTRYLNGKIDEFRIYNKAFSNYEIQLLYHDIL